MYGKVTSQRHKKWNYRGLTGRESLLCYFKEVLFCDVRQKTFVDSTQPR